MTTATDAMAAALADPDTFVAGPPWELFATLRAQEPVAWSPEPLPHHGFWSVTRHADIVAVSRDVEGFTSTRGVSLEELDDNQLEHRTSMIDTDPPRHTALRKILASQFVPRVINGYESFLRGVVARTLDSALPLGTFDFVEKVSSEIPVRVLARMLSVPDADHGKLTAWGDRLVGTSDPEFADVLDLDRSNVDLLTFGKGGPHFCLGSFLAKMEYRVTAEELLARIDSAVLAGPVERLRSNFVNGVKRMPVTVTLR